MTMIARIRAALSVDLLPRSAFEAPIFKQLALHIDECRDRGFKAELAGQDDAVEELRARVSVMSEEEVVMLVNELKARKA